MPRLPLICLILSLGAGVATPTLATGEWDALAEDGLHDPENPSLRILQEPGKALSVLAPDTAGNKVDWVAALRSGQIRPRTSLEGKRVPENHDSEIIMKNTLSFPFVRFPHEAHNLWMSCEMCHDQIFEPVVDGNDISMQRILEGEYCGVCHGAVAFPLTECNRCHSVMDPSSGVPAKSGAEVKKQ